MDEIRAENKRDESKPSEAEIFAEVSLFGEIATGSDESGDCGCFRCDGNPCVKIDA